jgi:hypothetical protein
MELNFRIILFSELQTRFTHLKKQVQLGRKRLVITQESKIIGFLIPFKDLADFDIPINKNIEMSSTQFQEKLGKDLIDKDIDCIYLTFHNRKILVFLSERLTPYIPLPLIG